MKKHTLIASISGLGVGFLGGLLISNSNLVLIEKLGYGLGGGLFTGGLSAFCYDTVLNNKKQTIERLQGSVKKIDKQCKNLQDKTKTLELTLETKNVSLFDLQTYLETIAGELKLSYESEVICESELMKAGELITELGKQLESMRLLSEEKEEELTAFAKDYDDNLNREFEHRKRQLVALEIAKEFELTEEAFQMMQEMDVFLKQVYDRHQSQREQLLSTNGSYHEHLQKVIDNHNEAYQQLENVKNSLELRVRILEKTIEDGLIQPIYRDYGVGSDNGKVVNRFVELTWNDLGIALEALGVDESTDCVLAGLAYPKKSNPETIVQSLLARKKDFAQRIGIYEITSLAHDQVTDTLSLRFRRERPKPPTDEQIYKDGLIPASQFCDQLFLATDHRKQGKPTLRVMAATGDGKGIAMKNFISYMVEQPNWEIWLSDPVHGSDEDYWHCPKMAKGVSEAARAYRMFADLHRARQAKLPVYTDKSILGIFDEFDKQHTDDDKETAKQIMTAIRHTNQRQILIGQCAEVGANGWTWDDMNNCSLLALGNSIGSLIKHLNKDLGWTITKVNKLRKEHEKFKDWARLKNENSDRPNENAYRIALLIVGGDKYSFLEVPSAHKGILRDGKGIFRASLSTENLEKYKSILVSDTSNISKMETKTTYPDMFKGEYTCFNPNCDGTEQVFKDLTPSKKSPRYKCCKCGEKAVISRFKKIN